MKYFDHDTEAYKDDRIVLLRRECGGAAIDAYWTLLEVIYREETDIKPSENPIGLTSVCFFLQITEEELRGYIDAMIRFGLLVESEDGTLTSPRAASSIASYQNRCSTNKENGGKGGRPRKKPVQAERKTEAKPNENPTETDPEPEQNQQEPNRGDKEKEKEREKENITTPNPSAPIQSDPFADIDEINDDGFAAFSKDVLDVFNAETGSSLGYFDGRTWQGLRRIFDAGRTIDDVRMVTRDKRDEWSDDAKMRRFIRPSTLYGDHFEEYLAVAGKAESEASEYDDYE